MLSGYLRKTKNQRITSHFAHLTTQNSETEDCLPLCFKQQMKAAFHFDNNQQKDVTTMTYDDIASKMTPKQMAAFEATTGLTIAEFVWSKEQFDEIAGLADTAVLDNKRLTADDIDEIVINKDLKSIRYDQLTLF